MCTLILSPTAVCKVVRMGSKACPIITPCFSKAILKTCQFRIKAKPRAHNMVIYLPGSQQHHFHFTLPLSRNHSGCTSPLLDLVTTFPERARQALSPKPLNWYHLFFPSGSALPLYPRAYLEYLSPSLGHESNLTFWEKLFVPSHLKLQSPVIITV